MRSPSSRNVGSAARRKNPPAHRHYNALFYQEDWSEPETRLISPPLQFGSLTHNTKVSFWHCQSAWDGDQDNLTVYYRVSDAGSWVQLTHYPESIGTWTLQSLDLPSPTNRYFVCFKGYAYYGYGIGLDDVLVMPGPILFGHLAGEGKFVVLVFFKTDAGCDRRVLTGSRHHGHDGR